jgi:hypothetical protein
LKRWVFSHDALSSCVAVALLAGCGGSQPLIGVPGAMPQSRAIAQYAELGKSWIPRDSSDISKDKVNDSRSW